MVTGGAVGGRMLGACKSVYDERFSREYGPWRPAVARLRTCRRRTWVAAGVLFPAPATVRTFSERPARVCGSRKRLFRNGLLVRCSRAPRGLIVPMNRRHGIDGIFDKACQYAIHLAILKKLRTV
jgi:hypothetical protein